MSKTENYYLITGSSSGLGEALSRQLKKSGFNALGIDRTEGIHTDINIDLSNISNVGTKQYFCCVCNKSYNR